MTADANDTILDDATCLIERSSVRGIIMQSQDIDVAQKALLLGEIDALPISTPRDWKSPVKDEAPAVSEWPDEEKVARAICEANGYDWKNAGTLNQGLRACARAVLGLFPEPADAKPCHHDDCPRRVIVQKVWNDRTKDWHPPHNTKPVSSGYGSEGER
jgi:hypothetical protein